ncbi:hypothetical protein CEXT_246821 [Caerostris extrusa]|uniref:Uncharacterized protein n=1 Tax=Caerostris extrusa TaxID=172846 RepID=A0AAV4M7B3_CAEEX|nr:hypothetical protein CEXT_246821 [Caerostris extrusa]
MTFYPHAKRALHPSMGFWSYCRTRTDKLSAVRATLYRTFGVWDDRKATLIRGTEKQHTPSNIIHSAIAKTTGNPASTGTFRTCAFIIII